MSVEQDFSVFVRHPARGVAAMDLVVEGVHCGGGGGPSSQPCASDGEMAARVDKRTAARRLRSRIIGASKG